VYFDDAPDQGVVGENVIIVVGPLAGRAGDGGAFEKEGHRR
jgi:hypothetical protein